MQISTLFTALTILALTAATPIAKDGNNENKTILSLTDTKDGGCKLKIQSVFKCMASITVDKTHTCGDLPKDTVYKGKTCGKGQWKVVTAGAKHGDQAVVSFDNMKDSRVACNRPSTKDLVCNVG
ncbi:MAG: hypothetical protein Q9221_007225 [Calogaya cf. arnoldii]